MGSWSLSIFGHGIHDNGRDGDVDRIVERFVRELKDAGHQLDAVYLTVGSGRKYPYDVTTGRTAVEYF